MEEIPVLIVAAISLTLLPTLGCGGGSSRQLQSITANANGMKQIQLTATGAFNASPNSITPLPVAWYVEPGGVDPPGGPVAYTLTAQPFSVDCQTGLTAVAIAPQNPSAPTTGGIPSQVWVDLVGYHTSTSEDGFVASPPKNIACP